MQLMTMQEIIDKHEPADPYKYMLMDRMKQDCKYFLGNGNRCNKHLWADSPEEQIELMKLLWNSFPADKKPEWLTMEDIDNFAKEMKSPE